MVKNITKTTIREERGAALAMSLIILSIMIVSAVALSRVTLGELRMALNTTNSLNAFYAADSAIEKSLYRVKFFRRYGDDASFNALG